MKTMEGTFFDPLFVYRNDSDNGFVQTPFGDVELSKESFAYLMVNAPSWGACPRSGHNGKEPIESGKVLKKLCEDVSRLAEINYKTGRTLTVF